MDSDIRKFVHDALDIEVTSEYEFRKLYGFTFVFRTDMIAINDRISSAEIAPIGIIYDENGEYYYAPLDVTDEIDKIVKKFVENLP